jgi:SAM-dependent methyltransferase
MTYKDYVKDDKFLADYNDYQRRYADMPSDRDRATIRIISEETGKSSDAFSLLDIGCSTGNFLKHVQGVWPIRGMLTGGDLAESSLFEARANVPGVDFRPMDMLAIKGKYDVITANAVCYLFDWRTFTSALTSVYAALEPGGTFSALDWYHIFDQDLEIKETSRSHPNGLTIHSRQWSEVSSLLYKIGFESVRFQPFSMSSPLPMSSESFDDLVSYTMDSDGELLCFRGVLLQPWCHLIARKAK